MKEKILNNFSLKILSAICAIILWAVIVNIYDPSISVTVSGVNVSLLNEQLLVDKGYTYDIVDGSKISVYIKGPRSIVSDIKASDIIATADLSNITGFTDYVDIDVKIVKEGVTPSSLEITPKTTAIKLDIENREVKTLDIEVEIIGQPADGYVVNTKKISPTNVRITGASSAVASVEKAKVVYDVSGVSFDINETIPIQLYSSNGTVINDDRIEMSKDSVEFRADLQMSKTVPVNFKTTGAPASGYVLSEVQYSLSEATVTGEDSIISGINSIEIPASVIDISGINTDKEYKIDLSKYVSEGVTIVSETKVTAVAKVLPVVEKEIAIDVDKINVISLAAGFQTDYGSIRTVKMIVTGTESVVNSIKVTDMNPSINLNNVTTGTVNANISVTLPNGCKLKQDYFIPVTIREKENGSVVENTTAAIH